MMVYCKRWQILTSKKKKIKALNSLTCWNLCPGTRAPGINFCHLFSHAWTSLFLQTFLERTWFKFLHGDFYFKNANAKYGYFIPSSCLLHTYRYGALVFIYSSDKFMYTHIASYLLCVECSPSILVCNFADTNIHAQIEEHIWNFDPKSEKLVL